MFYIKKNYIPFFSVLICTYNRANLLPRAIESLLSQDEKDWEALIIDDGSTDETYKLALEYSRKCEKIRYLHHSHRGLPVSRNAGIIATSGLYVTFLDSDDEYKPGHLSSRKEMLTSYPDVELLHGGAEIIGDPYVPDALNPGKMIHLDNCVIGGTFFVKHYDIIRIGGFRDIEYGDDLEFFDRAKEEGLVIAKTEMKTYVYHRDNPDTITRNRQINK